MRTALHSLALLLGLTQAPSGCRSETDANSLPSKSRAPATPAPSRSDPNRFTEPPSLKRFEDSARHYRNATGRSDYPRHSPDQFLAIAENILLLQRDNGGWPENWDPAKKLDSAEKARFVIEKSRSDSSFDNRSTYTHVEYLAEVHRRTNDRRFLEASLRGLEFILSAQHPSGLYPHSHPSGEAYRRHLTLMDDVTTGVLTLLRKVSRAAPPFDHFDETLRLRAEEAVRRGEAGLLRAQVVVGGVPTGWAGQYDETTFLPTSARSFELPSLVSDESVTVVRYLMATRPPRPEVTRAVEAAAAWLERSKIAGLRVETVPAEPVRYKYHTSKDDRRAVSDPKAPPIWARFYEIETNRPFMANRDGKKVYSLAEVERERRTGYRWYGYFASELLERELPVWRRLIAAP